MTINHVLARRCAAAFDREREMSKQFFVYLDHSFSMAENFLPLLSQRLSNRELGIFTIVFFNWLSIREIGKGSVRTELKPILILIRDAVFRTVVITVDFKTMRF